MRLPASTLAVLAAACLLAGCAAPRPPAPLHSRSDGAAIVWPAPPEPARVEYLGYVARHPTEAHRPGALARLRRLVLGADRAAGVSAARPFDVHRDAGGRLWVSSGSQGFLVVFDPRTRTGRVFDPRGAGALAKPMGLAGDAAGRLYVADPVQRRVVSFDSTGAFAAAWGGPDVLLNPVDVAVSPDGRRVYVVDSYLHQLVVFDGDGALLRRVGHDRGDLEAKAARLRAQRLASPHHRASEPSDLVENRGVEPGAFRYPAFVALGPDGAVHVSDGMNFRVQVFEPDGTFRRAFGRHGDVPGAFARPKGIAVDAEGRVYVADAAFSNVQVFDSEGRLLLAFGGLGREEGRLWMPAGLCIDADGRLHVADRYNDRVQLYLTRTPATTPPEPGHRAEAGP